RRVGQVAVAVAFVPLRPLQQRGQVVRDVVDGRERVGRLDPLLDGVQGEVVRFDPGQFVPGDRSGDGGALVGPKRVRAGDGAVPGRLVVVDEDPLTPLLLPARAR